MSPDDHSRILIARVRNRDLKHGARVEAAERLLDLLYGPENPLPDMLHQERLRRVSRDELKGAVLETITRTPASSNEVRLRLRRGKSYVCELIRELESEGQVKRHLDRWVPA